MKLALMIYCVAASVFFPPLPGALLILLAVVCRAVYRHRDDEDQLVLRIEPTFP
jgi:hypothetical protein